VIAHHCKLSDLWGTTEAAQPEIASEVASDKAQMAPDAHTKMPAPKACHTAKSRF